MARADCSGTLLLAIRSTVRVLFMYPRPQWLTPYFTIYSYRVFCHGTAGIVGPWGVETSHHEVAHRCHLQSTKWVVLIGRWMDFLSNAFRLVFTSEQIQEVRHLFESDTTSHSSSDSTFSSVLTPNSEVNFSNENHHRRPFSHQQRNDINDSNTNTATNNTPHIYTPTTSSGPSLTMNWTPYDAIADELGVERHIVQAVCERLAISSLV